MQIFCDAEGVWRGVTGSGQSADGTSPLPLVPQRDLRCRSLHQLCSTSLRGLVASLFPHDTIPHREFCLVSLKFVSSLLLGFEEGSNLPHPLSLRRFGYDPDVCTKTTIPAPTVQHQQHSQQLKQLLSREKSPQQHFCSARNGIRTVRIASWNIWNINRFDDGDYLERRSKLTDQVRSSKSYLRAP